MSPWAPVPSLSMAGPCSADDTSSSHTLVGLFPSLQEKRRAERAEQQRIRNEREKERQARMAVSAPSPRPPQDPESPTLQLAGPSPDNTQ